MALWAARREDAASNIRTGLVLSASAIGVLQVRRGSAITRFMVWIRVDGEYRERALPEELGAASTRKLTQERESAQRWVRETVRDALDASRIPRRPTQQHRTVRDRPSFFQRRHLRARRRWAIVGPATSARNASRIAAPMTLLAVEPTSDPQLIKAVIPIDVQGQGVLENLIQSWPIEGACVVGGSAALNWEDHRRRSSKLQEPVWNKELERLYQSVVPKRSYRAAL